jgi:group I intron endonuclease
MIIYKTTNLLNGKIYIGQDRNNNKNYLGSGKLLKKAIKKYGKDNFKKEILEECQTEEELNDREVFWISQYNSTNRDIGYNISDGSKEGDRKIGHDIAKGGIYNYWVLKYGKDIADEKRATQIDKIKKHNVENGTDLTKKGRYAIWLEKYGKDEADIRLLNWKLKISEYQQYRLDSGWKHSEESINKIRDAAKDRKHSEESKEKMRKPKPPGFSEKLSKAKMGIPMGPSKKRKEVIQYGLDGSFIKVWESISKVEQELKVYNVTAVCKGKQETAGGYKWKYKNNI